MTTSRLEDEDRHALTDQDFRDASERLLFVFPELRESFRHSNSSSLESVASSSTANNGNTMDRHSGVLWKRRDVFKNRWRPRWFALNPGQGILTYFLLNDQQHTRSASRAPMTPNNNTTLPTTNTTPRNRTTSWDSQVSGVSENSLDYDVVPRGTIFLLGCTVYCNDLLSKPSEHLFAFTIRTPPQSTESHVHLAARTVQGRQVWIDKISMVCNRRPPPIIPSSSSALLLPAHLQTPPSTLYRKEHSIPEDDVLDDGPSPLRPMTWTTLLPTNDKNLYQDLPESMVAKIQEKINTFVPMCDADLERSPPYKILLQSDTLAAQTTDEQGRAIVVSQKHFQNIPPMHIFSLLIDISRRHLYEWNVQADVRIKVLNDHTFLDYYSYRGVWPTSSREFAVCTHWQIMHKNQGNAILMVSFSCPESDAIRPVQDGQVRGNAIISLVLLEENASGGCKATRIVSFDLGGNISSHLSNLICAQQAGLPTVVQDYLQRNEPETPECFRLPISYDVLWKHVVARVAKPTIVVNTNGQDDDDNTNEYDPVGETFAVNGDGASSSNQKHIVAPSNGPSLELQAMLLLAPVLIHKIVLICGLPGSSAVFALSVFVAVRHVVTLYLGDHLGHCAMAVNSVTCRFRVDPKGLQRFVANKREEREELKLGTTKVLPLHLVVSAVALALKKTSRICRKRVQYPMLFIDRVVTTYKGSVDVTVMEKEKCSTVRKVTSKSVIEIAQDLSGGKATSDCGQCLVVALEDLESTQLMMDATSRNRDVVAIAVIQGLREIGAQSERAELPFLRGRGPSFKVSVSLTIQGHSESIIHDTEEFARECQKMLQFPEICED